MLLVTCKERGKGLLQKSISPKQSCNKAYFITLVVKTAVLQRYSIECNQWSEICCHNLAIGTACLNGDVISNSLSYEKNIPGAELILFSKTHPTENKLDERRHPAFVYKYNIDTGLLELPLYYWIIIYYYILYFTSTANYTIFFFYSACYLAFCRVAFRYEALCGRIVHPLQRRYDYGYSAT